MVLTHMTLKYDPYSDLAADPFFQSSGFQVSNFLPTILQQEPNLSILVASFMDQINDIRKMVGFLILILRFKSYFLLQCTCKHPKMK